MRHETIFDSPAAFSFMEARRAFLEKRLPDVVSGPFNKKTALDCGGGVGYFAAFLAGLGFRVTSFDARPENVEVARQRHPDVDFRVGNLEDPSIRDYGTFDVVICLGLLYHLENPMSAVRNLYAVTGGIALVESVVVPARTTTLHLIDEVTYEDQGVNYVAFNPSESCLLKLLYAAGFSHVYRFQPFPDHWEFKTSAFRRRGRTFLLAAHEPMKQRCLAPQSEPRGLGNPWVTPLGRLRQFLGGRRRRG